PASCRWAIRPRAASPGGRISAGSSPAGSSRHSCEGARTSIAITTATNASKAFCPTADGKEDKLHGHNAAFLALLHLLCAATGASAQISGGHAHPQDRPDREETRQPRHLADPPAGDHEPAGF